MKVFKLIVLYLNILRFWPHLICYALASQRSKINEDLKAYSSFYKVSGSSTFLLLHFLFYHRSYRTYFYYRIGDITKAYSWLAPGIENLIISKDTKLGTGILFFHAYSTIVNAQYVGNNCRILQNVTVGEWKDKKPVIGNNVYIYPGAVITGDIIIGDNTMIGPGAVVFKSIPENCVVVGNPAYILKQDGVVVNKKL